jgi:tyrosine-protein kinase Etk/Wzc
MNSDSSASFPPNPEPSRRYPPAEVPDAQAPGLAIGDLFGVLRRQIWLILAVVALAFSGAYYVVSRQVGVYRAEALIRLRDGGAALVGGVVGMGGAGVRGVGPEVFASERFVLQGRGVGGDVVDRQGLRLMDATGWGPPSFAGDVTVTLPHEAMGEVLVTFEPDSVSATMGSATARAAYGAPLDLDGVGFTVSARPAVPDTSLLVVPKDQAIDWVIGSLGAALRGGTDIVAVSFNSPDRTTAIRVVNAVVEAYKERSAKTAQEEARARRAFLDQELGHAEGAAATAQTGLERFREREQVYRLGERAAAEQSAMLQREIERRQITDERRDYQALLGQLDRLDTPAADATFRTMVTSPAVARHPLVNQMAGQIIQYALRRDSLLIARVPPTNESVRQLDSTMANAKVRTVEVMRSHVKSLDDRLARLDEQHARSLAEMRRLSPTGMEEDRLERDVAMTRTRLEQLRQQKELVRISEAAALGHVEIVEPATRAFVSIRSKTRILVMSIGLGLLLGCGIAFLLENLNTSIHRRSEVEALLQIPGLAVIPQLPNSERGFFRWRTKADPAEASVGPFGKRGKRTGASPVMPSVDALVTVTHSNDRSAEAYRALRTKLLFLRERLPLRTLVVTSASVGEGKTTTAANIATALAQQGLRTLLVDCDLRRPRLHRLFGLPRAPGLTDLLKNSAQTHEAIRPTAVDGLHLLPRGNPTSQPAELLGGDWMVAALRHLGREYDMVVIDTPPLLSASDAASLAGRADGVLLVLRAGQTRRAMAQEAMHQLAAVGATVIGAVLNDPDAEVEKYESYGYAYSYPYEG